MQLHVIEPKSKDLDILVSSTVPFNDPDLQYVISRCRFSPEISFKMCKSQRQCPVRRRFCFCDGTNTSQLCTEIKGTTVQQFLNLYKLY